MPSPFAKLGFGAIGRAEQQSRLEALQIHAQEGQVHEHHADRAANQLWWPVLCSVDHHAAGTVFRWCELELGAGSLKQCANEPAVGSDPSSADTHLDTALRVLDRLPALVIEAKLIVVREGGH